VIVFCLVLCSIQQLQGTSIIFSTCTFLFIVIATIGFNVAGGFVRPSGTYVFSYAVLTAIIGITYKVFVGEPGQSNLQQPERTIEVYLGTICSIFLASYMAHRFSRKEGYILNFRSDADMHRAAIGCFVLGAATALSGTFRPSAVEAGSLSAAFQQLNSFLPLAMVLGTFYTIRSSNGKRSISLMVFVAGALIFSGGIIGYSKQGFFTPFVCWLLPAASQRYKVSLVQIAGLLVSLGLISYYLVPYSQYGRSFRIDGAPFSVNFKTNVLLLSNLDTVRKIYNERSDELYFGTDYSRYYDKPQGFADRLQMLTSDDLVISYTENGGVYGLGPTLFSYANLIPHFIWPSKPIVNFGNIYAHEIGLIVDESDTTTGISFSPSGDMYHQAKWLGILVVLPVLLFILFFMVDSCCGDTRKNPIALAAIIGFLHAAPEGGVNEIIRGATFGIASLFLASFLIVYLMPMVANLMMGPAKDSSAVDPLIASKPGRMISSQTGTDTITDPPLSIYRWSKGRSQT
jgi:hypothetical protein